MSTTRFRLSVLVVVIGLSSCNSFNRYEINTAPSTSGASRALAQASLSDEFVRSSANGDKAASDAEPARGPQAVCPVYHLPKLDPAPDLPYDQLEKLINSNDNAAYDQMAQNEIKALYQYIDAVKKKLRASHQKYLEDCQAYLAGHQNSLGQ